jgi:uncharacterized membrane protein
MLETIGYVLLGAVLLFAPGFLFSVVLYPKRGSLDFWTRMGMSLGLGVMMAIIEGYTIAKLNSLVLGSFVIATFAACVTFIALAFLLGGLGVVFDYVKGTIELPRRIATTAVNIKLRMLKVKKHEQHVSDKPHDKPVEPAKEKVGPPVKSISEKTNETS